MWPHVSNSEPWLTLLLNNTFPKPLVRNGAGWWWLVLGTTLLLLWQPLYPFSYWCYQNLCPQYSLSSIRVESTGFSVEAHAEAAHLKHGRHTRTSIWHSGNVAVTPRATSWCHIFLWTHLTLWLHLGRAIQHYSALIALKFREYGVLNCNAGARCHPQGLCVLQQDFKRDHIKLVSFRRMETSVRSVWGSLMFRGSSCLIGAL